MIKRTPLNQRQKELPSCLHAYEMRENDGGFYWLCIACRKHKPAKQS